MPRMIRMEMPGSCVHIMARGIDGKKIFINPEDYKEFLARLSIAVCDSGYKCLAWCLMENHYHLFVRSGEKPMSALMRPLNGGYARWFNAKYKRRGYLFQDRFKSVLCQDQEYAKQLIRYIHLNPVRSGLVDSLDQLRKWRWCGHGFLLGVKDAAGKDFQDRRESMRRFGNSLNCAVSEYLEFLTDGIDPSNRCNAGRLSFSETQEVMGSEKGWPAVIGDPEFARRAMSRFEIGHHRKHRKVDYLHTLEGIAKVACSANCVNLDDLWYRGRENGRTRARALFCFKASREELLPLSEIARYLRITIPGVSKLVNAESRNRK